MQSLQDLTTTQDASSKLCYEDTWNCFIGPSWRERATVDKAILNPAAQDIVLFCCRLFPFFNGLYR